MSVSELIYNRSPLFCQTVLLNIKALELYIERYGPKFWKKFNEFQRNQWKSASELNDYQDERLTRLIRHAFDTVPYYNRIMKQRKLTPNDFKGREDLHKLPVLSREQVKRNPKELLSQRTHRLTLRHGHTSGTTGSPLELYYDLPTCVVHHVADWRHKNCAGLSYGEPYASLQGRVIVPLNQKVAPFWRKNYLNNQLFLSSFHLKYENIPQYLDKLEKEKISFLEGYPSTVYILAMYLHETRQTFPMKAILTSSETLFDFQRELIERVFCCRIFDFYGMAERVLYATECNHHQGRHINSDYGIVEFLDTQGNQVETGKMGRIVATGLHNFAMPLIRYETNDSSAMKQEKCSCGRGFPLMDEITTKQESIITLPDGRLISPSVLTHPFKPMHNIVESQIIQEKTDTITIKIVRLEAYGKKDEEELLARFHERIGSDINIRLEYVPSIPRTGNGKFQWVISKIHPRI